MVEILAALSASAAGGLRIALPLLAIGVIQSNLWDQVPLLSRIHPQLLIGCLVSWSLFELILAKSLMGQRIQNIAQLLFSPIAGSILGMTVAAHFNMQQGQITIIGLVGGSLAFLLQLVQVGWFFRLGGIPLWIVFIEDLLCVFLVVWAFDAPKQGGIIAMMLLWIALRSSSEWRRRYVNQAGGDRLSPRKDKLEPD
jgi:hypothetical protein